MKKILLMMIVVTAAMINVSGQVVTVTGATGTAGPYTTLGAAFVDINATAQTGNTIVITVSGSITETGTVLLGSGAWTSISIQPTGGAPASISGAIAAGSPLLDFSGADNVNINGLNSGGNSLTIANTTASATSGTSTIRFIGGATNNTITNCAIQGSSSASVATNGATIFFSTDAVTTAGNDNNTISNNDIGPAGANLPTKAILGNGSTTTTAIGNSGNVINNNNIFDYFGAAVTSAGIATNGGCNNWSITNNRFYQTAPRVWTTGSLNAGINIQNTTAASGAQGFTITGNVVGFASNSQTGVYTLSGAGSGAKFIGILFNGIVAGTLTNINNNTVASVSMTGVTGSGTTTASPFTAILAQEGLVNTNNNTIGSQTAAGSLVFATTTTSATDVYGIHNFSSNVAITNNNNIGGINVTNLGASGTFILCGIRAFTGSTVAWTANNNVVGGSVSNSMQLTATGAASQVLGLFSSNAPSLLNSDTARNLTNNIGTGTITTASVIGISITTATPNHSISQCVIYNLYNSNTTAASVVTGLQFNGSTANTVARNKIYGLTVATTSTASEVNGIRVAGGTTTYRNNMIAVGAGIANAIGTGSTTGGINGIFEAGGTNNFYHNSIFIGGAPTAGVGPSYAFASTQVTVARAYRDNIFFNARSNSGATGKNYAIRVAGTAPNPAGLTINSNVYFANGTGAVFGFFNSLDVANIAAWKTAVGQDANSFEGDPKYIDPANATTPDLHINPTVVTVIEGNGVDVGVTDDFDGQTRSGLTPVDIGADAGNFIGVDLSAPVINYTALTNTSLSTNRTISVTITDQSGVATGGLAPRIYYNKNAGAYFSTVLSLTSGTVTNGVWTATIDYSLVGGVVPGDVIRYYVTAQDVVGNIGANPSAGFAATDVNTVTSAPTTPNQYVITAAFAGSYDIGTGQTYTSLTNAGGIFEAINAGSLTGNVTLNIVSDLTVELGTNAMNQWAEDGAGNYTMLIRPSGAARTITGSNTGAFIRLNGADNVTIEGSTTGASADTCTAGGSAALRELTIQNTNVSTSAVVIAVQTGTNGAKRNTIKNVNVVGQDPTTTLAAIAMGGNTPGTAGADNDSNRVENCSIKRAIYGIYTAGASAANPDIATVITLNSLDSVSATDRVRRIGIVLFNDSIAQVTHNSISGINTNESADGIGIGLGVQAMDNTTVASGNVVGSIVAGNKINGVASLSATGFSASGIAVAGGTTAANTIRNNMITAITAPATSPDLVAGIFIIGVPGSNTKIYHNSVSLTGDRGAVATQMPSYAIAITGSDPTVELKNNIFYTTQTASGGGAAAKAYAIGMTSTTFVNFNSDYNDYWSTGVQDGGFRSGSLGVSSGTDYADITAWKLATGKDANSVEVLPPFVSDLNNLHLTPSAACATLGKGVNLPSVTTDFDCNSRNTLPFMGAHEAYEPAASNALAGTATPGATSPVTRTYTVSGATDYMFDCNLITTITPGTVSGLIKSSVSLDSGATKLGTLNLYVARNYDITPAVNPGSSSATVKLYFLQSEFDNFNAKAVDSNHKPLPTGPTDVADADNMIIRELHGNRVSRNPLVYTGAVEDFTTATAGVTIFWNATMNRWEVTVPVTAFSGFYITSKPLVPVAVKMDYFRGATQGSGNILDWKVNCTSTSATLVLQRSTDARNFRGIFSTNATALRCLQPFSYTDVSPVAGINYYRLQMTDADGKISYSSIVALMNAVKGFEPISITPNPVTDGPFKLNISSTENSSLSISITDITGRLLMKQNVMIQAGFNTIDMNTGSLSAGVYQLSCTSADGKTKTLRFVKQ